MANYLIIGGDGKEYGPVTDIDVRLWIAEGRLSAQSLAKAESDAEFRPLGNFPEFAGALATNSPAALETIAPPKSSAATDFLQRDYELDLGDCISRAWTLVKNDFGPIVGTSALVIIAMFGINQLFGLITHPFISEMIFNRKMSVHGILIVAGVTIISAPFSTIFMAGLFKYYLKLIRGEPANISSAFSGFGSETGQLILLSLAQMVLVMLGYAFCLIPGVYLAIAWYFAVPLVIDRRMSFWSAMELSRRMVSKHWFMVFACLLVFGLLATSGAIACGVGLFVTMPIGTIALMYAYETIFGEEKN